MGDKPPVDLQAEVEMCKREGLAKLLGQCTEKEQAFYHRIFPAGPTDEQFWDAVRLVERTIKKGSKDA